MGGGILVSPRTHFFFSVLGDLGLGAGQELKEWDGELLCSSWQQLIPSYSVGQLGIESDAAAQCCLLQSKSINFSCCTAFALHFAQKCNPTVLILRCRNSGEGVPCLLKSQSVLPFQSNFVSPASMPIPLFLSALLSSAMLCSALLCSTIVLRQVNQEVNPIASRLLYSAVASQLPPLGRLTCSALKYGLVS
jgi:hypothetical protein